MSGTYSRAFALDDIEIRRGGDGRVVEAYCAMFSSPYEVKDQHGHYMEVIERSAFDKTLASGPWPICIYNHGASLTGKSDALASVPLGTPLEVRPDSRGLFTVTRYNRTELADSVLEAIRHGDIKSQSFRGAIRRSTPDRVPKLRTGDRLPTITRTELGLTDYGPTPIAVNPAAEILAVRGMAIGGRPAVTSQADIREKVARWMREHAQDFARLDEDGRRSSRW